MQLIHIDTGREWRGGQSQLLLLAAGLKRRGFNSTIVARPASRLAERAIEENVDTVIIPMRFELDAVSARRIARLRKGNDVILHAHTPHALSLALMAARWITDAHVVFSRRVSFPLKKSRITRWKLNQSSCIVAVSEAVSAELQRGGIAKEKIRVIHSSVAVGDFPYLDRDYHPPLDVAILGSIEWAKGLNDAMQIVKTGSRLPLQFHFFGEGAQAEDLKTFISNHRNVRYHGFLKNIGEFFRGMHMGLSCSPSEGFPNLVLQAMSSGLVVVAKKNPAVDEIMRGRPGSNQSLGLMYDSPADAIRCFESLLTGKVAAATISRSASHFVQSTFSSDRMVENYLALYREILAKPQ